MTDSSFRIKKVKDAVDKGIGGTLDSVHQSIINSLKESTEKQETLIQQISSLEKELCELESTTSSNSNSNSTTFLIAKKHEQLRNLLLKIKDSEQLVSYFSKNADLMLKYYSITEDFSSNKLNSNEENTFLKYLCIEEPKGLSKKQVFDEYVFRMKMSSNQNVETIESDHCTKCNVAKEEIASEGILTCPLCGSEEYMMVVSDTPGFNDPPKERNNYAYKKINHLNEILNQFQAKESTIIPEEVMNEIIIEIRKRRIQNVADLCEKDIREILKKIDRSKYYEHVPHIVSRLNGNPPPTITPEIEEKIRAMFQEIQAPFLLFCPDDRTNFLSYSYILYKFFELLELDEYKIYFPLLKSRDRLIAHDQIWEKICEFLRWEFIRSV
jgi:hypothetical protein